MHLAFTCWREFPAQSTALLRHYSVSHPQPDRRPRSHSISDSTTFLIFPQCVRIFAFCQFESIDSNYLALALLFAVAVFTSKQNFLNLSELTVGEPRRSIWRYGINRHRKRRARNPLNGRQWCPLHLCKALRYYRRSRPW